MSVCSQEMGAFKKNIFGNAELIVIGLGGGGGGGLKKEAKRGRGITTRRFHRKA